MRYAEHWIFCERCVLAVSPETPVPHSMDGMKYLAGVAAAVNDAVVSRAGWDDTRIAEGDRVEVLTAVQGG